MITEGHGWVGRDVGIRAHRAAVAETQRSHG
jgi:hypothetical protein